MTLSDWLRLFRAQTAPATVYAVLVPYVAAGGRDVPVIVFLFAAGHLLHYASFGHNSLMDYILGFDKHDPNKKHHPLVSGRLSTEKAAWVIHSMLFVSLLALGGLATVLGRPLALFVLLLYVVWGYAYNNGIDHLSEHSWLPISLAFAFLPDYGVYLASNDHWLALAFWLWGFLTTYYQIDWEGNLKDMWNPVDRAARKLGRLAGCAIENDRVYCLGQRVIYYYVVRTFSHVIAAAIALNVVGVSLPTMAYLSVLLGFSILGTAVLHFSMASGRCRPEVLELMGKQEVLVFYVLLLALLPAAPPVFAFLAVYGVAYFVLMNRILWASRFGPRV